MHSYYRQLQSQAPGILSTTNSCTCVNIGADGSQPILASEQSTFTRYSDSEAPPERDDWWYKGTDNLFLNRSGEHRMCSTQRGKNIVSLIFLKISWVLRPQLILPNDSILVPPILHGMCAHSTMTPHH
jgi:hypothetical protein